MVAVWAQSLLTSDLAGLKRPVDGRRRIVSPIQIGEIYSRTPTLEPDGECTKAILEEGRRLVQVIRGYFAYIPADNTAKKGDLSTLPVPK